MTPAISDEEHDSRARQWPVRCFTLGKREKAMLLPTKVDGDRRHAGTCRHWRLERLRKYAIVACMRAC